MVLTVVFFMSIPSFAGEYAIPTWLKNKIKVMQPVWVARYKYNEQTAYLMAYPQNEEGSPVFDASGRRLCTLSAWDWSTAKGCPQFEAQATDEKIVWGEKYAE